MLPLHCGSKLGQAGFVADDIVGNAAALLAAGLGDENAVNHITGKAAAFNGAADLCFFAETSNTLFDFQDIGMLFVKFINLKMLQIFFP